MAGAVVVGWAIGSASGVTTGGLIVSLVAVAAVIGLVGETVAVTAGPRAGGAGGLPLRRPR